MLSEWCRGTVNNKAKGHCGLFVLRGSDMPGPHDAPPGQKWTKGRDGRPILAADQTPPSNFGSPSTFGSPITSGSPSTSGSPNQHPSQPYSTPATPPGAFTPYGTPKMPKYGPGVAQPSPPHDMGGEAAPYSKPNISAALKQAMMALRNGQSQNQYGDFRDQNSPYAGGYPSAPGTWSSSPITSQRPAPTPMEILASMKSGLHPNTYYGLMKQMERTTRPAAMQFILDFARSKYQPPQPMPGQYPAPSPLYGQLPVHVAPNQPMPSPAMPPQIGIPYRRMPDGSIVQ